MAPSSSTAGETPGVICTTLCEARKQAAAEDRPLLGGKRGTELRSRIFRASVRHAAGDNIEACPDGKLHYDHIAETPEMVAAMKEMGRPALTTLHGRFAEFRPLERLVLTQMIDFLPGVEPYESTIMVNFFPSGEWVRMVVTLRPMHDEEFTKLASQGLASQLTNMDKRFPIRQR